MVGQEAVGSYRMQGWLANSLGAVQFLTVVQRTALGIVYLIAVEARLLALAKQMLVQWNQEPGTNRNQQVMVSGPHVLCLR